MIVVTSKNKGHIELPDLDGDLTISVVLVDYITKGNDFFKSWQWSCKSGLESSSVVIDNGVSLLNKSKSEQLSKNELPVNSWDNFLQVVVTIDQNKLFSNKEVYRFETEFVSVPNCELETTEILAKTQFSGSYEALLSYERFFIFLTNKNPVSLRGKSILLSGCGTGAEALILKMLGAKKVVGYDIDRDAIDFAKRRFGNVSEISFVTEMPKECSYDLVISRHVMEHIPRVQWTDYLSTISGVLKDHGQLLIDVPNHCNPREAHTELLFFHYLDSEFKRNIFDYCDETQPAWFIPIRSKMKALLEHRNVEIQEIVDLVPQELKIEGYEFIDNNSASYSGQFADNIRVLIAKQ